VLMRVNSQTARIMRVLLAFSNNVASFCVFITNTMLTYLIKGIRGTYTPRCEISDGLFN